MFDTIGCMGKRVWDWKAIQRYHDQGHGTAWVKAIKRGELVARFRRHGGRPVNPNDRRRVYDSGQIQAYYDAGNSYRQCQAKFGFNPMSWHKARCRGEIKTRPQAMPIDQLLGAPRSRTHIKGRLISAGLLENKCQTCGLESWLGKPISMHIDHINGVRDDHRLENLRMLCPNCHSQTETYSGRNAKRKRRLQDHGPSV